MKIKENFLVAVLIVLLTADAFSQPEKTDYIYYVSLNEAIQEGQLEGIKTVSEILKHGDFGLGSEENLASELVLVDGKAYEIFWNGKAVIMNKDSKIAYCAVKFFKTDTAVVFRNKMDLTELEERLRLIIDKNAFAAIRIKARFSMVQFRSYKKTDMPFTTTEDALADTLVKNNMEGVLIGFYTPESAKIINSPTFHFHVLDAKKSTGGHVLKAKLESTNIEIDYAQGIEVALPDRKFLKRVDLTK